MDDLIPGVVKAIEDLKCPECGERVEELHGPLPGSVAYRFFCSCHQLAREKDGLDWAEEANSTNASPASPSQVAYVARLRGE